MNNKTPCPKCESTNITGIQYGFVADRDNPCHYDGISEWKCECGYREGRWSGKELKDGEHEPPYGERHSRGCRLTKGV